MIIQKACPQCGHIVEEETDMHVWCEKCLRTGHMVRMMSRQELIASADRDWQDGYLAVAEKRRKIAERLLP